MVILHRFFLLAALVSSCSIADTSSYSLSEGEAFAVLQLEDFGGMNFDSLIFNRLDSKDRMIFKCRQALTSKSLATSCARSEPLKVTPGRYYLRSIRPYKGTAAQSDTSARSMLFDEPDDRDKIVEIKEGAVIYLGDWIFYETALPVTSVGSNRDEFIWAPNLKSDFRQD